MKLDFNKADFLGFLTWLQIEFSIDTSGVTALSASVFRFTLKGVEILQKVKIGTVSMVLELASTPEGAVSINIGRATFSGLSLFGAVKAKARGLMMGVLGRYSKFFSAIVVPTGQIILSRTDVKISQISVGEDRIIIGADLKL